MSWLARLELQYRRDGERTIALDRHEGPLRVLQRLYPEGSGICHHVLVHPPGGIVGGDVLEVHARLEAGTHALVTTPGATRFYRSDGALAVQQAQLQLDDGARLEWLPLETIAYRGCLAENRVQVELAPTAEAMGWDILALGLPATGEGFDSGRFLQHLAIGKHWLERGQIDAADALLRQSPLGLAGHGVLGSLWFAAGRDLAGARRDTLLDAAREAAGHSPLARTAGATSPHARVVVLRVLADRVEPLLQLFVAVRQAWRQQAWQLDGESPRIWRL